MDDFRAKITGELDTSKIEEQLEKLNGKKIKLDVDTGNMKKGVEDVDRQITTTTKVTQSFG